MSVMSSENWSALEVRNGGPMPADLAAAFANVPGQGALELPVKPACPFAVGETIYNEASEPFRCKELSTHLIQDYISVPGGYLRKMQGWYLLMDKPGLRRWTEGTILAVCKSARSAIKAGAEIHAAKAAAERAARAAERAAEKAALDARWAAVMELEKAPEVLPCSMSGPSRAVKVAGDMARNLPPDARAVWDGSVLWIYGPTKTGRYCYELGCNFSPEMPAGPVDLNALALLGAFKVGEAPERAKGFDRAWELRHKRSVKYWINSFEVREGAAGLELWVECDQRTGEYWGTQVETRRGLIATAEVKKGRCVVKRVQKPKAEKVTAPAPPEPAPPAEPEPVVQGFTSWQRGKGYTPGEIRRLSNQKRSRMRKEYIRVYLSEKVRDGTVSAEVAADLSGLAHPHEVCTALARA